MRARLFMIVLAAVATHAPPAAADPARPDSPDEIYAVVVGHNGGRQGLPALQFADDDALRFALMFNGLTRAQTSPSQVWLLSTIDTDTEAAMKESGLVIPSHERPTRTALFRTLDALKKRLAAQPSKGNRVLYFVYAGHGQHGQLLLEPEQAQEAAITGTELRTALAALTGVDPGLRIFVFVDACRSQSLFSERGAATGPDFSTEIAELERGANAAQIGVLTAATTGKPAGELSTLRSGLFSHALASGLAGAADADSDDVVTFGELVAFVAFNTQGATGQTPWFDPPAGDLKRNTIDHRGRAPRLRIRAPKDGRYRVESSTGRPIFAEVYAAKGQTVTLTLPPGHYRVHRTDGRDQSAEAAESFVDLEAGQTNDMGSARWKPSQSESRADRGIDPTPSGFDTPFTTDVVAALTAGYESGRTPSVTQETRSTRLLTAYAMGSAPLELGGAEQGLMMRVSSRGLGPFALGIRSISMGSSHRVGENAFSLFRQTLVLEGGYVIRLPAAHQLEFFGGGGSSTVLQRRNGGSKGGWFAPTLATGFGLSGPLRRGLGWTIGGLLVASWIEVDGARNASTTFAFNAGLWWIL